MKKINRAVIAAAGLLAAALLNAVEVKAAEKDMSVTLNKGADEATFKFEFEEEQDYIIDITLPSGELVSKEETADKIDVQVMDASSGEYTIRITAEGEVKVHASVELKNTPLGTDTGEVTMTSSFTDINIWFVDGNLSMSWDDGGAGNAIVEVTNPKTMQKISSETVQDNTYYLELDKSVEEITVYIVPASCAKIDGAGVSYTIPVVRVVHADVLFPKSKLINKEGTDITVRLQEDITIIIANNGSVLYEEKLPAGEHEIYCPLASDTNRITVYTKDAAGNMQTYEDTITRDLTAPGIKFNATYDGMGTYDDSCVIAGTMTDGIRLYINEYQVETDEYGRFSFPCYLEDGDNQVTVRAVDEAGNEKVIVLSISKFVKKKPIGLIVCIGIVIAGLTAGAAVFFVRKKMEEMPERSEQKKEKKEKKIRKEEETDEDEPQDDGGKKTFLRSNIVSLSVMGVILLLVFVFFRFCIAHAIITSGSMEPTLMTGDIVIFNRLAYVAHPVERGDIIYFYSTEKQDNFAKRVIGTEGDVIEFRDGYVFINGMMAVEDYIPDDVETNSLKSFTVPAGCVFVLGDNRENSYDSRHFENPYIPIKDIRGKYLGTLDNPFK